MKTETKSLAVKFDLTLVTFPDGSSWLTDAPDTVVHKNFNPTENDPEWECRYELRDQGYEMWRCPKTNGGNINDSIRKRTSLTASEISEKLNTFMRD